MTNVVDELDDIEEVFLGDLVGRLYVVIKHMWYFEEGGVIL